MSTVCTEIHTGDIIHSQFTLKGLNVSSVYRSINLAFLHVSKLPVLKNRMFYICELWCKTRFFKAINGLSVLSSRIRIPFMAFQEIFLHLVLHLSISVFSKIRTCHFCKHRITNVKPFNLAESHLQIIFIVEKLYQGTFVEIGWIEVTFLGFLLFYKVTVPNGWLHATTVSDLILCMPKSKRILNRSYHPRIFLDIVWFSACGNWMHAGMYRSFKGWFEILWLTYFNDRCETSYQSVLLFLP